MTPPKPADPKVSSPQQRLNSWKEIAAHLGVSVRTVQRWEAAESLPVRRHRHAKLSSTYAYANELDRWWDSRPEAPRRLASGVRLKPERINPGAAGASIVVLPFVNLDRDEETEIFSDGLTEDLITALSQIRSLRVVARSSAFYFKGKANDVREIGASVGVGNVLEGSLRRTGNRLRVTAQLVSAADGCHLWAQRFDHEMEDPFDMQERLAEAIASGLCVPLLGQASVRRSARDIETYNAFLRGRFFWNQRTPDGLRRALECFKETIRREPEFAPGHAGIAECNLFRWAYAGASWHKVMPTAKAAISRALRIDSALSGIHTSLGLVRTASFDIRGAEAALRRALESNPGDHRARHWHAMTLAGLGRIDEGLAEIERAVELDPLGVAVNHDFGRILYFAGRYGEAIARLRHTLEIAPQAYWARIYLALACIQIGAFEEALTAAAAVPELAALIRSRMGDTNAIQRTLKPNRRAGRNFTWSAALHLERGEKQRAIESLKWAVEQHEPEFLNLCLTPEPLFDGLRSAPAFGALLSG